MSDHISYNLTKKDYNVSKYVPYGPVEGVLPYLIRRAQENTSVAGQTGRELSLILEEIRRRKKGKVEKVQFISWKKINLNVDGKTNKKLNYRNYVQNQV